MSERKRVLLLISIMAAATLTVTGITLAILYRTSMQEQRERLVETVQSEARLIEAIARFDAVYIKETLPGGAREATLSQVIDAHKNYEQAGRTAEFTLAYREGDNIVFLLRHRHADLKHPMPTKFDSKLAQPMRLALSGLSGAVIGLDYRGEIVQAAHEKRPI